jgi:hypothetical protein
MAKNEYTVYFQNVGGRQDVEEGVQACSVNHAEEIVSDMPSCERVLRIEEA